MSHHQRATIVALLTNLLVNGYAIASVGRLHLAGALSGDDAVRVWAQAVVWVIPAAILSTIVLTLLFQAVEKERGPRVMDERDRLFRLRGVFVFLVFVGVGYTAMLTTLAIGWPTVAALNLLFFATASGDLVGNVTRLASYRMGD